MLFASEARVPRRPLKGIRNIETKFKASGANRHGAVPCAL